MPTQAHTVCARACCWGIGWTEPHEVPGVPLRAEIDQLSAYTLRDVILSDAAWDEDQQYTRFLFWRGQLIMAWRRTSVHEWRTLNVFRLWDFITHLTNTGRAQIITITPTEFYQHEPSGDRPRGH